MRIITTADGKQYPIWRCGAADGVLWIGLSGMPVETAERAFSDASATKLIISSYEGTKGLEARFDGFTALVLARAEDQGTVIALRKDDADATD